jgi:hypothetical protein
MSMPQWSPRPAAFGFVLFFLLLASRNRSMWWTAAIGALWINLHGSWPVAILWLLGVAVGTMIDERRFALAYLKQVGVFTAAVVVGGVANPVGWTNAFEKSHVFSQITEWRSPDFHNFSDFDSYGPMIGLTLAVLLLTQLRVSWRHALPFAGLFAMSLYSARYLPMLGIGLASIVVPAWQAYQQRDGDPSEPEARRRWGPVEMFCIIVMGLVGIFQVIRLVVGPDYALSSYPVAGMSYAEQIGYFQPGRRVYMPDFVGCYRILVEGKDAGVFIDDRYDMYPERIAQDSFDMIDLRANALDVMERHDIEAVLWPKDRLLSNHLTMQPGWTEAWSDKHWVLLTHKSEQ